MRYDHEWHVQLWLRLETVLRELAKSGERGQLPLVVSRRRGKEDVLCLKFFAIMFYDFTR